MYDKTLVGVDYCRGKIGGGGEYYSTVVLKVGGVALKYTHIFLPTLTDEYLLEFTCEQTQGLLAAPPL